MKYWTINKVTREVIGSGEADKWNMPRNVLLIEPLPPKEDFAVIATTDLKGTEYVADHRGKIIYNKDNLHESKQVEDLGEVGEGWTLEPPETHFDEWIDGCWVTNQQAQYEAQVQQITTTRESLYVQVVDRLNNEAKMIRRVEGDEAKASEYEAQADAAYLKIRADNPWPTPPEV
ncbi:hypothetical protein KW494_10330 [Vibrio fluvialis]|nr:hypothetical protein [Vibrio fluvialis]MBY8295291.1 hypothetical protein [Vibrio fluvialis]